MGVWLPRFHQPHLARMYGWLGTHPSVRGLAAAASVTTLRSWCSSEEASPKLSFTECSEVSVTSVIPRRLC